ncbi:hypothetical protein SELMODRAFT_431671 [Selaginella moellendorffii]|uniref:Protein prenyltransferase alpha subunit repeat-containing protein 1 n=1 Tax=Selaginella moellendorffii TaxID=88036 RepID=D8TDE4_SELML|nr:protein prenyltransferase alpha subunit repeat-containing protein 1 [Selaginella moellendorffii]EFJ05296.1 hypothetical protein SELMODRAFT_431671 [Selaginella moellendorffii]|eukprot:XP_002993604.1 protein prenyltransferase alpha subunit repeat-containing protein 1 [Selaginella moellendorffii]
MECGTRLLADLGRLLDSDPEIDELGFLLPSQLAQLHDLPADTVEISFAAADTDPNAGEGSKSPCDGAGAGEYCEASWFWLRDHKLGIAVNALRPLYTEAQAVFSALRAEEKQCGRQENGFSKEESLLKVTRALLIVNSDYSTAWNTRKRVLGKSSFSQSGMISELRLSSLVLTYAPKSEEAWAHRRWALNKIFSSTSSQSDGIIDSESKHVDAIVERSPMNYRAWRHRCWLISFMKFPRIELELKSRDSYRCTDNCFFHYRRSMLQHLIWRQHEFYLSWRELASMWKEELKGNAESIKDMSFGNEALWIHRRFLAHGLLTYNELFNEFKVERPRDKEVHGKHVLFILNELELAKEADTGEHSCSYKLWLLFVFRRKHDSKEVENLLLEESSAAAASTPQKESLWKGVKGSCNFLK